MSAELLRDVRLHIYAEFVESGAPPTVAESAAALGVAPGEVEHAYRELESTRVIVLAPGTLNVWMANPFSAVPTPFRVETERRAYWGNCIWDALGIPAMLRTDATVSTWCPDCQEPMALRVASAALQPAEGVIHFAVPAARWWDNIGFT